MPRRDAKILVVGTREDLEPSEPSYITLKLEAPAPQRPEQNHSFTFPYHTIPISGEFLDRVTS